MVAYFPLMIPGSVSDGGKIEVVAPYDGALIATVTAADSASVEKP